MAKTLQRALVSRSGAIIGSKHNNTTAGSSAAHGMWPSMPAAVIEDPAFVCASFVLLLATEDRERESPHIVAGQVS